MQVRLAWQGDQGRRWWQENGARLAAGGPEPLESELTLTRRLDSPRVE